MGFPVLQGEARDGRTRPERVTGVMGQWAGKGHRGDRAAWVEVGDPGLIRASDSSAKKGADANAQPPGSAQTRGNRQLFRDCSFVCPQGGTSYLPSAFCLGKVPKCLWERNRPDHTGSAGPAHGGRSIIG